MVFGTDVFLLQLIDVNWPFLLLNILQTWIFGKPSPCIWVFYFIRSKAEYLPVLPEGKRTDFLYIITIYKLIYYIL